MKIKAIWLVIGIFIGMSVPTVFASQTSEIRSYIGALHRIIALMEQMQVTSQETAENTRAIKEKLGAK